MKGIKNVKSPDHGYRFPAVIISCAGRWYMRFNLSLRNIEGGWCECSGYERIGFGTSYGRVLPARNIT